MNRAVWVDGFDIDSIDGFSVRRILHQTFPNTEIPTGNISSDDGTVATAAYYKDKPVIIEGEIARSSMAAMDVAYREIMQRVNGANKTLRFDVNSSPVEYVATLEAVAASEPLGGFMTLRLTFRAHNPLGLQSLYNTVNKTITTPSSDIDYSASGNYPSLPVLQMTLSSFTTSTEANTIIIGTATGSLLLTRVWVAGDVIVIDSETKEVTVNGDPVIYAGNLPALAVGDGQIDYSDDFDTRSVACLLRFKNRYL